MYAGSTLTRASGYIIGAHQKIDRIARRNLEYMIPNISFPSIRYILHFEGNKGPDSIKRKSPSKNEPWHFIRPYDDNDTNLISIISNHFQALVSALKEKNNEKSSFEAAWLAHAVVDGLTPAHQYPYTEELSELRNGEDNMTRNSIRKKLIMPGGTGSETLKNNWKMWGPKGLFTTHLAFEFGIATLIAPLSFRSLLPSKEELGILDIEELSEWYRKVAKQVAQLKLYEEFYETGWTLKLSKKITKDLTPIIINAVTTIWYQAYLESRQK